ncbi:hypothetical protein ACIPQ1_26495 [Pseudomonas sp. LARHCG127]
MSSSNLLPAGLELERLRPSALLVVGGDDYRVKDVEGKPRAAKVAAIHAASIFDWKYLLPAWSENAPLHLLDFNDLAVWREGRV